MNLGVFQTPLNHSYSCLAEEVVKSKDDINNDFTLRIREIQLEAYRANAPGHHEFSAGKDLLRKQSFQPQRYLMNEGE